MSSPDDLCATCSNRRDNHPFVHPFREPWQSVGESGIIRRRRDDDEHEEGHPVSLLEQVQALPKDPVLRRALVDAGVLTTDALEAAERALAGFNRGLATDLRQPEVPR